MDATAFEADQDVRRPDERQRIIILGATGSIGQSALDIIARSPDRYEVVALVGNSRIEELARLARQVNARYAVTADAGRAGELKTALSGSGIETGAGQQAVMDAVERPCDMVIGAIVGAAGLVPTLASIKPGRSLALANKECLVCAGPLVRQRIEETGARLLPVDSEHSAIFQVFEKDNADQVEKVILTASGGPFRQMPKEDLASVTPEQALKHPNWSMGSRITIDSATLMNKGFEVIEAFHLFPLTADQLDVLVHPQSIVHGLVQYRDGSLLAQMGSPDMRTPIAHCLAWPRRIEVPVERLDLAAIAQLSFEAPDHDRFPALKLAMAAMTSGMTATISLNAADEIAVDAFLNRRLGFTDIVAAVEEIVDRMSGAPQAKATPDLAEVLEIDVEARRRTQEWILARS